MKLNELLEKVNNILDENLKRKIINTSDYGYKYDEENGRKVYDDYRFKDLICELSDIGSLYVNITKAVNLEMLGITFKLKRKKSGMKSNYNYSDRMTYSEIIINDAYTNKLDLELEQIQADYKNSIVQNREAEKNRNIEKVDNFKKLLSEYGLNVEQFKMLNNEFEMLNFTEKRLLYNEKDLY